MITKEEMERVWREEPVGWLKKHIKESKGKSPFVIFAKPYTKQYLDPIEMTVYAKDSKSALKHTWELSSKVREKYPFDQHKNIAWEYGVKNSK
jgi:hypothetical protein